MPETRRPRTPCTGAPVALRPAAAAHARRLHALISAHVEAGHLLPRTRAELTARASRFVIATRGRRMVGCAELAPLSPRVAEVRSLAVDAREQGEGVGRLIVDELRRRAGREGFEKLCAFTHAPSYFIQMGFSIVPHGWLLEKITTDCLKCARFRTCGQYAMVVPLEAAKRPEVPARPTSASPAQGVHALSFVRYAEWPAS